MYGKVLCKSPKRQSHEQQHETPHGRAIRQTDRQTNNNNNNNTANNNNNVIGRKCNLAKGEKTNPTLPTQFANTAAPVEVCRDTVSSS
jgi:hypothetical protein